MKRVSQCMCLVLFTLPATVVFAKTDRKTEFQQAIDKNKTGKIARLIKKSSPEENVDGLLIAAASNSTEAVTVFLEAGINVNSVGNDNQTPLMSACLQSDNVETVKLLLENGANVSAVDGEGRSALYHTIMRMHECESIIEDMIKRRDTIEIIKTDSTLKFIDKEATQTRIKRSIQEMVELLIQFGADVNEQYQGHTMLFIAQGSGFVNLLSRAGAKYTEEEEREIQEAKQAKQLRLEQERARKRVSSDNFYNQVIYRIGIPLEIGDEFTIKRNRIEVLDRTTTQAGYTYLVTYFSSSAERSRDYVYSFSGGGTKYCFLITSKWPMKLYEYVTWTGEGRYVTSVNDLKLTCIGIGKYESNYQDVDCYVFTLDAEL